MYQKTFNSSHHIITSCRTQVYHVDAISNHSWVTMIEQTPQSPGPTQQHILLAQTITLLHVLPHLVRSSHSLSSTSCSSHHSYTLFRNLSFSIQSLQVPKPSYMFSWTFLITPTSTPHYCTFTLSSLLCLSR